MENRRDFLGTLAAIPLVQGLLGASEARAAAVQMKAAPTDAEMFARLRGDLLFPRDVT